MDKPNMNATKNQELFKSRFAILIKLICTSSAAEIFVFAGKLGIPR
jgi:hypothetical protein